MKKIFFSILYTFAILTLLAVTSGCMSRCCQATDHTGTKKMDPKKMFEKKPLDNEYIDRLLPDNFYQQIRAGKVKRDFYPPYSDEAAWKKAAQSPYAPLIIQKAEKAIKTPVPPLLYSNYHRFTRDGNRTSFQTPYMKRRENLAYIALAMCLTRDKEKYMLPLLDYTVAIMEEWTWCLPAHLTWQNGGKAPGTFHITDLFCAETGAVLTALHQILGDELEKEWVGIKEWMQQQIMDRTVYNIFCNRKNPDATHHWVTNPNPQNWTIWCSSNVLYIAMVFEKDPEKLEHFTRELIRLASRFTGRYHEDGFCPEGPRYYGKAAMMLFRVLDLLEKTLPGSSQKAYQDTRIRNMFEFIAKLRLGKDHLIAYSDTSPEMITNFTSMMPAAAAIKSDILLKVGSGRTSILGGNGDHLLSSLALLFDYPENIPEDTDAREPFTLFPNRIAIFRSSVFDAAVKGGFNGEPHNHLDLGHISIYLDGEPVIVDPGTGAYTKKHFSKERYSIWYLSSYGHNAPIFGGHTQTNGDMYIAPLEVPKPGTVICDLSSAYPAAAGVKKFTRTLTFKPEEVVIADDIKLSTPLPAEINLITPEKPQRISEKEIKIGNAILILDGDIELKEISDLAEEYRAYPITHWKQQLSAVRLTGKSSYRMIFRKAK